MAAMARWLTLAALAGCGHATPPPAPQPVAVTAPPDAAPPDAAPLDADLPRLAARSTELYKDLAGALAGATDCAAAAAQVEALSATYADAIAATARVLHGPRDQASALRAALEPHRDELAAAAQAIAAAPCIHDAALEQALDHVGGIR
jgi:hypothetical protein